jgi:hypothetical protein
MLKIKIIFMLVLFQALFLKAQEQISSSGIVSLDSSDIAGAINLNEKTVQKNPRAAMLRSIFVPGWGQLYNEKRFKAVIIAGTECGLVINAIVQNQLAINSVTTLDKEFYKDNRSLSFWWLAGVILYSSIDAYVDAHLFDFDESPNLTINIKSINNGPLAHTFVNTLSLEWRF